MVRAFRKPSGDGVLTRLWVVSEGGCSYCEWMIGQCANTWGEWPCRHGQTVIRRLLGWRSPSTLYLEHRIGHRASSERRKLAEAQDRAPATTVVGASAWGLRWARAHRGPMDALVGVLLSAASGVRLCTPFSRRVFAWRRCSAPTPLARASATLLVSPGTTSTPNILG